MHGDGWELVRVYPAHRDGSGHGIIMDDYRAAVVAYLRRVKDESGLSLNEVAQRVGVSHTTLTRPLNNPLYKYVPKFATLQRIALATGIELPGELTNAPVAQPTVATLKLLTVRGVVAAGMWQAAEVIQDVPLGEALMVEDPAYAGLPQWAELLRGPSMNRTYLDGDYLHVVDAAALGYFPRPGDDVIVERRSAQDGKIERTCKRVAIIEGARVLVGDSTIEHWNAPLPMESADDTLVQVIGLVVGSYRARKR
jgi:transcriptional regulator with XRE-family HTH domain